MSFSVKKDIRLIVSNGGSSPNYWSPNNTGGIYNNSANVGINIQNPDAILDVSGQTILRTPNIRIGVNAGNNNQGVNSIAIGQDAGLQNQIINAIAIGTQSAQSFQNDSCVAIGNKAGQISQLVRAVAIGSQAGQILQGLESVAIGFRSGEAYQNDYAIAIGLSAGETAQGSRSIAIGDTAGGSNQNSNCVAIGNHASEISQGESAISIGTFAGYNIQKSFSTSIGHFAGYENQGTNAIAIGMLAGQTNQQAYSIVIDASGTGGLNGSNAQACYIRPIRSTTGTTVNGMVYDPVNFEIRYDTGKTFVISHPLDNQKYLVHACLEGPEAGVYYRGTSTINENENSVEISLPDYVSHFSNEFTVHVTSHSNTIILSTSQIQNNKFTVKRFDFSSIVKSEYINDSKPLEKVEFSWLVFAKRHSIDVEPNKLSVVIKGDGPYKYIAN